LQKDDRSGMHAPVEAAVADLLWKMQTPHPLGGQCIVSEIPERTAFVCMLTTFHALYKYIRFGFGSCFPFFHLPQILQVRIDLDSSMSHDV
jgi:hypothetical protein